MMGYWIFPLNSKGHVRILASLISSGPCAFLTKWVCLNMEKYVQSVNGLFIAVSPDRQYFTLSLTQF